MTIDVQDVGHVVLKVTDLDRSLGFYCTTLGLTEVSRRDFGNGRMVFLSSGRHHHLIALVEVSAGARRPEGSDIGLFHVALKIGDDLETLRSAKETLEAHGVPIHWIADHRVSQSLYVEDPDGNNVELFVDADPSLWQNNPDIVGTAVTLEL